MPDESDFWRPDPRLEQLQAQHAAAPNTDPRNDMDPFRVTHVTNMDMYLHMITQRLTKLELENPSAPDQFQERMFNAVTSFGGGVNTMLQEFHRRIVAAEGRVGVDPPSIQNISAELRRHRERFEFLSNSLDNQRGVFIRRFEQLEARNKDIENKLDIIGRQLQQLGAPTEDDPNSAHPLAKTNQRPDQLEALTAAEDRDQQTRAPDAATVDAGYIPPRLAFPVKRRRLKTAPAANPNIMYSGNNTACEMPNGDANRQTTTRQPLDPFQYDHAPYDPFNRMDDAVDSMLRHISEATGEGLLQSPSPEETSSGLLNRASHRGIGNSFQRNPSDRGVTNGLLNQGRIVRYGEIANNHTNLGQPAYLAQPTNDHTNQAQPHTASSASEPNVGSGPNRQ